MSEYIPKRLDPMISYAQQAEDVILRRAFPDVTDGFYVDVGAAWPVDDSVTKYFYEKGWRGINIEPNPDLIDELQNDRPEDVNLRLVVASTVGKTTLSVYPKAVGWSTASPDIQRRHEQSGLEAHEVESETRSLDSILEEHAADRRPSFVKIDVEGGERGVLEAFDIRRWQPSVIVVEATQPGSPEPAYADWEELITSCGYTMALFDGLNRWYANEPKTIAAIGVPANSFDSYIPYRWWKLISRVEQEKVIAELRIKRGVAVNFPLNEM
jgi:FkbM family methyltransferase